MEGTGAPRWHTGAEREVPGHAARPPRLCLLATCARSPPAQTFLKGRDRSPGSPRCAPGKEEGESAGFLTTCPILAARTRCPAPGSRLTQRRGPKGALGVKTFTATSRQDRHGARQLQATKPQTLFLVIYRCSPSKQPQMVLFRPPTRDAVFGADHRIRTVTGQDVLGDCSM